jgi:hypothetical protein
MTSITGYEWPQHTCLGADCICKKQWPNTARPYFAMRHRDDSLEFDARTLQGARAYIAALDCDARVYVWDTITNKVL